MHYWQHYTIWFLNILLSLSSQPHYYRAIVDPCSSLSWEMERAMSRWQNKPYRVYKGWGTSYLLAIVLWWVSTLTARKYIIDYTNKMAVLKVGHTNRQTHHTHCCCLYVFESITYCPPLYCRSVPASHLSLLFCFRSVMAPWLLFSLQINFSFICTHQYYQFKLIFFP